MVLRRQTLTAFLLLMPALVMAATKMYDVVPYRNCVAQARPDEEISQSFINVVDSLTVISVWVGDAGDTSKHFEIQVRDSVTSELIAQTKVGGAQPTWNWSWMLCSLVTTNGKRPIRGRTYRATLTRQNGVAISYAYDPRESTYAYGCMSVGATRHPSEDLAMRVYGACAPLGDFALGMNANLEWYNGNGDTAYWQDVLDSLKSSGVRWLRGHPAWWDGISSDSATWDFDLPDSIVDSCLVDSLDIIHVLCYSAPWASACTVETLCGKKHYPPRSLYAPIFVDDTMVNPANLWATYVYRVGQRYKGKVTHWEAWNEPDCEIYWNCPIGYYDILGQTRLDTARQMCSLYVRLCAIADTVLNRVDTTNKLYVGSVTPYTGGPSGLDWNSGVGWLLDFYDLGGTVPDGMILHPYGDPGTFDVKFKEYLDTTRSIMRSQGDEIKPIVCTEYGIPTDLYGEEDQAKQVTKSFVFTAASLVNPSGPYDHLSWFQFIDYREKFGLTDLDLTPKPAYYSHAQVLDRVRGMTVNGRVLTGDPWKDDNTRIFEFADPGAPDGRGKFWVAWRRRDPSFGHEEPPLVDVGIPTRTDVVEWEYCAYSSGNGRKADTADTDGWYDVSLGTRPLFIFEPETTAVSRPDIVADSIRIRPSQPTVGRACTVYVWVHDHGTRALANPPGGIEFLCNGEPLGWRAWADGTDQGGGSIMFMHVCQWLDPMHAGRALFSAVANPNQDFVELGMDDNTAYRRTFVFNMPEGQLDVFTGPWARTGVPLLMMRVVPSWPAESARAYVEYYGSGSTLLAVDSTDWFRYDPSQACLDTFFPIACGEGKLRCLSAFKDTLGNSCAPFSSMQDTIVFDSVPPECGVVVNSGERFVTQPQVLVETTPLDSTDVPFEMRFGNGPLASLTQNSGFVPGFGAWEYSDGCGYGSGLEMGEVVLSQEHETWVRQFIPCGAFPVGNFNRQHRLSADLLGLAKNYWSQLGWLEFGYAYLYADTSQHDSVFQWLGSAQLNGPMDARVGLNRAFCDFILLEPNPDPNLVWQDGIVRLRCPVMPVGTSGTVWLDNCALSPSGQFPQTSSWQPFQPGYNWQLDPLVTGEHEVSVAYRDNAGNETWPAFADTVILDMEPPMTYLQCPAAGYFLSDTASILGWAFDWPSPEGDTYFLKYTLEYRHPDSTYWSPVDPDSVSYVPAWPDTQGTCWFPRHLGYWNTTLVPDGPYFIRLTATDSAGNSGEFQSWVYVCNTPVVVDCATTSATATSAASGSVYLGTATGQVIHYSEDLDSLGAFSITDSAGLANITALLSVGEDSVIAADAKNLCVHKLKKNGQGKRKLLSYPGLIPAAARDNDDNIWAVDQTRSLLAKVRSNGTLAFTRGGQSADSIEKLKNPEGLAVRGELVYVADTRNNRIAVWDTSGVFQRSISLSFMPQAIVVTDSGAIFVVDKTTGTILGLNSRGEQFYRIPRRNNNPHKHLVLSEDQHYVFAYQPQTKELLKYQVQSNESMPGGQQSGGSANLPKELTLNPPRPNPTSGRVTISYAIPKQTNVTLRIYDVTGRSCRTLAAGPQQPGNYQCVWNHDDDRGRELATGIYFVRLDVDDGTRVRKVVLNR